MLGDFNYANSWEMGQILLLRVLYYLSSSSRLPFWQTVALYISAHRIYLKNICNFLSNWIISIFTKKMLAICTSSLEVRNWKNYYTNKLLLHSFGILTFNMSKFETQSKFDQVKAVSEVKITISIQISCVWARIYLLFYLPAFRNKTNCWEARRNCLEDDFTGLQGDLETFPQSCGIATNQI